MDITKRTVKLKLNGEYVDVDELIAPIIEKLNNLGYKTAFSCSGHTTDDRGNLEARGLWSIGYIAFKPGMVPIQCGKPKAVKRVEFKWEECQFETPNFDRLLFNFYIKKPILPIIKKANAALKEWADGLKARDC